MNVKIVTHEIDPNWEKKTWTVYFLVQVDREGKTLGFRDCYFYKETAENGLALAELEFKNKVDGVDWPIWKILEREIDPL